jgi:cystathionine beta-lyase
MSTQFDFDTPIERRGTASLKWERYRGRDVIPLWVADMDFRSAPAIIDALRQRVEHGVFGYPVAPDELISVVIAMLARCYAWKVEPKWIVWLPGLVTGLNVACRAVGGDGDEVITSVPVYPPFLSAPRYSRRNLVTVPLHYRGGRWRFDPERLEQAITRRTRLPLLCSPYNPAGRVFERGELEGIVEICKRHDVLICSDEIHCDLVLDPDRTHIPTATLGSDVAVRTITLMAPSKTFNIAGLGCSFAIIPGPELRQRFLKVMAGIVPGVNALGYAAALAAYRDAGAWHGALLEYLRGNRETVAQAISRMPGLSMASVEATYLAWIDARETGLENPTHFFEQAGVGLSDGRDFGAPGFVRLNFGCRRAILEGALQRMNAALGSPKV